MQRGHHFMKCHSAASRNPENRAAVNGPSRVTRHYILASGKDHSVRASFRYSLA
jgi:hypothetical protein